MIFKRRARSVELVDAEGERHRIPLPPHSEPCAETNACLTGATIAETRDYFDHTLAEADWTFTGLSRALSGNVAEFRHGDKRLRILMESQINILRGTSGDKWTFAIATNVQPSQLEQDVAATKSLGEAGGSEAVEHLIALLDDPRAPIRREAATSLAGIKDERSLGPLIERLNDDDGSVQQHAAYALGALGDRRAAEPLIAALNAGDQRLGAVCAFALGQIRDERALPALRAALERPYFELQVHAALTLGDMRDRSSADPLRALLKDPDSHPKVRTAALVSLKEILSPVEFSALVESLPARSRRRPSDDAFAEDVADLSTSIVFDILGIEH
jgi:HEAT repeat protein/PBS lyase HEAT-like repeat-containing protein